MKRDGRTLIATVLVIAGTLVGAVAGLVFNAPPTGATPTAAPAPWEHAAVTAVSVTPAGGKVLATAWIRYFQKTGANLVGVNAAVDLSQEAPRDEAALRDWVATTNSREGLSLTPIFTAETTRQDLYAQARRDAVAKAIARLGEEGYEMANTEAGDQPIFGVNPRFGGNASTQPLALYFKRRAQ